MHESEKWNWSRSVVSNSYIPHGLQPTRLLHPWHFPGKSTGVGCHCLSLCNWKFKGKIGFRCDLRLQVWFDQWFSQFWSFKVCFVLRLAYFIMVKQLMQFQASQYITYFPDPFPQNSFVTAIPPAWDSLGYMPWTKDSGQRVKVKKWMLLSCVQLFVTPWTMHSMEFSRPEY